jgi:hypothetical protein
VVEREFANQRRVVVEAALDSVGLRADVLPLELVEAAGQDALEHEEPHQNRDDEGAGNPNVLISAKPECS